MLVGDDTAMTTQPRNQGRYSPGNGLVLPAKPFRRKPPVPCPAEVGDRARAWWSAWAQSGYAWHFGIVEWLDLADTARLMDRFYEQGDVRAMAEARQHMAALFGLATRARLHVTVDGPPAQAQPAAAPRRSDPRLRAVR
jgi:hypothetical protein